MNTKAHCYPRSIILQAVYFELRFTLRYRDVEEIMKIRGLIVDHATIQRLVSKLNICFKLFLAALPAIGSNLFCPTTT
ncbi:IS6 family transposase [Flavobacterium sp. CSZ]|uniref:IS6 family transposase n=1 Tax=Flavobacterium sp. CSZ TaxID=2783791 RepID=UPI00188BABBA|nr:IS6 family transposase [Flavobacterium sp. CSZ]MBF4486325.1 IS6 family transposase [Flavobacterium sp. CSZ]